MVNLRLVGRQYRQVRMRRSLYSEAGEWSLRSWGESRPCNGGRRGGVVAGVHSRLDGASVGGAKGRSG